MRMIVLFDLPTTTKKDIRNYNKFRDFLIDDGFIMMQYSVYSRYCKNSQDIDKHTARVSEKAPPKGNVRIIKVTERQYENMIYIVGEKNDNETIVSGCDYTITI